MSEFPEELRYTESHEWVRLEDDGTLTVGISDHAQEALGDIVYVELPEVGSKFAAKNETGVVESVKAASDTYAPVSGTIIAVNHILEDSPEQVNDSPYDDGWFFKMQANDLGELAELLDAKTYQEFCETEVH